MRGLEKIIIMLLLAVAVAIPACSQKEGQLPTGGGPLSQGEAKPVTTEVVR